MATMTPTARDARFDFRLSHEHKRMIEQAATATGQSLSDFAVAHLVEAAQRAIADATITKLTMRDRDTFLHMIESDAKPNQALSKAAARYKNRRG